MRPYRFEPLESSVREAVLSGRSIPHVLSDRAEGFRTWCNSVIRWRDGTYHAYYARWPVKTGHHGWLTHCEIAHGVSDRPQGPFVYERTILASRNPGHWDVINASNPYAITAEGRICLYYITNRLADITDPETGEAPPDTPWDTFRNAQVTGVAIADNPYGPFTRAREPVVVPHGRFKNIAVNPAVLYRDGRYLMIIKGDDINVERIHRIQLVGESRRPEGPFMFLDTPLYDRRQTEDACIWFDETTGLHNVVVHVMGRDDLAWFVSRDGFTWRQADTPVFMKKEFAMTDGSIWKPDRVERPFVLTDERGRPQWFYVAIKEGDYEANIAVRILCGNAS